MSYKRLSLREIKRINGMIRGINGTGHERDYLSRIAFMINNSRPIYAEIAPGIEARITPTLNELKNNLLIAKKVFEEEIMRVRDEKAENLGELIKKYLYLMMLRKAEKLSYKIGDRKKKIFM